MRVRRRNLPHWTEDGSTYYVTFRTMRGTLSDEERQIVLDHLISGDGRFYILGAAVIMPDHVHLLIRPAKGFELSRIMKGIKGASARKINLHRGTTGTVWQDESWDRIVRDAEEFQEKLQYMADNPVKAELVRCIDDYPFWFCQRELLGRRHRQKCLCHPGGDAPVAQTSVDMVAQTSVDMVAQTSVDMVAQTFLSVPMLVESDCAVLAALARDPAV